MSGSITGLGSAPPMPPPRPDPSEMFKKADANSDGKVDKAEFLAQSKSMGKTDTSKEEELFSKIDANGDGSIDETENNAFIQKMDEDRKKMAEKLFAAIDTNGDNSIDENEAQTFLSVLEEMRKSKAGSGEVYTNEGQRGDSVPSASAFNVQA